MKTWRGVLARVMGPGKHPFEESDLGSIIMSPGETITVVKPYDDKGADLLPGPPGSPGALFNEGRAHIGVEVCYCSTLGDCWITRQGGSQPGTTTETRHCPAPSERTFLG
jgi:hypothetical protein